METSAWLNDFSQKIHLSQGARQTLFETYERVVSAPEARAYWEQARVVLFDRTGYSFDTYRQTLEDLGSKMGIHPYTLHMTLVCVMAQTLRERYIQANIPLEVFYNTMADVAYKAEESRSCWGVYGCRLATWMYGFFIMDRFGLGRMQYEIRPFKGEQAFSHAGITLLPGEPVLNMHIPSGGPLTRPLRLDSYRRAHDFFRDRFPGKPTPIVCHSWLLYPRHDEFLPPTSNILDFGRDFTLLTCEEEPQFSNAWRVFADKADLPPEQWPEDTALRRAYKQRVLEGKPTGAAYGVLLFDGSQIL